jgi:hypothetical protein
MGGADIRNGRPTDIASITFLPEVLSRSAPHPSESVIAEKQVSGSPYIAEPTAPLDGVTAKPKSDLPALRQKAETLANQPMTKMFADVSTSETTKPDLLVYFPRGSARAEANARRASAEIESDLTRSNFEPQDTFLTMRL